MLASMRYRLSYVAMTAIVASLCLSVGCRAQVKERTYEVKGTVRIDGQLLRDGTIGFKPVEGQAGTLSPPIPVREGAFELALPAGKRIGVVGDNVKRKFYDDPVSQVTIEVKPDSENHFDLEISSRSN
ncbi:MAG: hypothetical protein ACKOWG_17510 [Planctomycetia bacterium]